MSKSNSDGQRVLLEYVEAIESLEAEKKQTQEKIKAVYAEIDGDNVLAGGLPVSSKAIREIVKHRKADSEKTAKLRAEVRRVTKALGELGDTELGEWAKAQIAAETTANNQRPPRVSKSDAA